MTVTSLEYILKQLAKCIRQTKTQKLSLLFIIIPVVMLAKNTNEIIVQFYRVGPEKNTNEIILQGLLCGQFIQNF